MEETKSKKIIKWIVLAFAIAINVFIIINACIPGAQSSQESNWIVEPIKNIINAIKTDTINASNYDSFSSFIRKFIGHFSLFGLSGVLTTLSYKFFVYDKTSKLSFFIIFSSITGLFLAILTEFIQLLVPGRSGEILDVLIDLSGYFIGLLIVVLIVYILKKRSTRLKKE